MNNNKSTSAKISPTIPTPSSPTLTHTPSPILGEGKNGGTTSAPSFSVINPVNSTTQNNVNKRTESDTSESNELTLMYEREEKQRQRQQEAERKNQEREALRQEKENERERIRQEKEQERSRKQREREQKQRERAEEKQRRENEREQRRIEKEQQELSDDTQSQEDQDFEKNYYPDDYFPYTSGRGARGEGLVKKSQKEYMDLIKKNRLLN